MNQYFYEHAAREKLGQLRKEGQLSQAFNRTRLPSKATSRSVLRFIAVASSLLAVILIWAF
jgi:hypothetical protein